MIRLLGILSGSAAAVAILLFVVGVPRIANEVEPEPVLVLAEPVQKSVLPEADVTPLTAADAVVDAATPAQDQAEESVEEIDTPAVDVQRWYAFWSPFRSRIAANGFVAQLQRVTGLDYRVVNVKPGVYEVAFAYSDHNEIQANLSQISAATGLDIPES